MDPLSQVREYFKSFIDIQFKKPVEVSRSYLRDILLFFLFVEYFGLDNPLGVYTIDLYPHLMEEFHIWHRSLGIEKTPFDFLPCC
ncbi:MAG: cory-CC-star protein [Hydrogenobacter sp.]|uniref:cory-CC-star protein n=1 Tax=Hydrogenobacter thermophilus TaxID=940 RepID=UPI0030F66744